MSVKKRILKNVAKRENQIRLLIEAGEKVLKEEQNIDREALEKDIEELRHILGV